MPRLVILSEGLTGKAVELKSERTTIGRVDDNMFAIPEASVSSHHCEVLLRGSDVVLRDLDSTNGTFISGQQLTGETVIKPGQIIRLGQVEMRLESTEPKPAAAAKKLPDQTMVIPQGVKLGQETPTKVGSFDTERSGFAKKNNTGTKVFIGVAVAVFVVLICVIIYLVTKAGPTGR